MTNGEPIGELQPLSLLGVADMDYVAARILMLSGLIPPALAKASEAVEKILKLLRMQMVAIRTGALPKVAEVRGYSHRINELLKQLIAEAAQDGIALFDRPEDVWVQEFIQELQSAYERRYPDKWAKEMRFTGDLEKLDATYVWLRNLVVANMPAEWESDAKRFFSVFARAFSPEVLRIIQDWGVPTPYEWVQLKNMKWHELTIEDIREERL